MNIEDLKENNNLNYIKGNRAKLDIFDDAMPNYIRDYIGTCGKCKHWHTSERFMDKYGQGCGQCSLSFGDEYGITFCSHQCFMCERKEENENVK